MKKLIALLICVFMLFTNIVVFAEDENDINSMEYFENVLKYVESNYKYEVSEADMYKAALEKVLKENPEVIDNAIDGVFESMDKYSTFFYKEEFDEFALGVTGRFTGIGVVITSKDDYITVVSPIENTPAFEAGIITGDRIVEIDGQNVVGFGMDKAAMMLRGEEGTFVSLKVMRGENELYFDLTRRLVKLNPIYSEVIDDTIGYIRIIEFNANAKDFMQEVLEEYREKGIRKLIVDVRNNPGGELDVSFGISSFFISEGETIVNILNNEEEMYPLVSNGKYDFDFDIVVLVNEGSASAAEIFTGAMKDNEIATVVGEKTFGKGTAQKVVPLKIGGGIKITISEFLTPNEDQINNIGIEPDIKVQNEKVKADTSNLMKLNVVDKYTIGSESEYVMAAEQRLSLLGYDVLEPDNYYDEKTFEVVKTFQARENLFPYGVLDLTTQGKLKDKVSSLEYVVDNQLEEAIELLK